MSPFLLVDDATGEVLRETPVADQTESNTNEGTSNDTKDDAKPESDEKKTDTNDETKSDASDEEPEPKKKVDAAEPMKAELKHLDRKYSEKHKWYFAETVEDKAVPDQVDW